MSSADKRRGSAALLLGIRHHGPGSARAVVRALSQYQPEMVLIEGPPEADPLVRFVGSADLRPPVALLAYQPPGPGATATGRSASFWPFGEFSPEWQAMRWAVAHDVPVRFMDLPIAFRYGRSTKSAEPDPAPIDDSPTDDTPAGKAPADQAPADQAPDDGGDEPDEELTPGPDASSERIDPIGALAEAAGYDDPERWWEDVVEHQLDGDPIAPFEAIALAMTEVRAAAPPPSAREATSERRREAYMRTVLRAATKQHQRVAVVCGAWHVPALSAPLPSAAADATVLKGLSKGRVAMTWVPWTHGRLASWTGYGAGVTSPGWYHHLFTSPDRPITRWLVGVAGLLRAEGLPVSSAHVLEATRLAEALAILRGRPLPGLAEVSEATLAVLCDGDELRQHLVDRKLVVGEQLGTVPADTPSVPLAADVAALQRRLRLTVSALASPLNLDLRQPMAMERSRLLHRLRLLGVEWGTPAEQRRGQGTFWEDWQLAWRPEFAVDLIAASGYGTTVETAATAKVAEAAGRASAPAPVRATGAGAAAGPGAQVGLPELTALVQQCLLADLPAALPAVLGALADRVALDAEVGHLMEALPALARTLRYGDVRGTELSAVRTIAHGLVVRVCVGLPAALTGLDDAAAAVMRDRLDGVDGALSLLGEQALIDEWREAMQRVVHREDLSGLLAGRLTRLLFDAGCLDGEAVGRDMARVLTIGVPPARAAAWVEGFLAGGGLLLVHDERLLSLVDGWLAGIPDTMFVEVLPLLRRTFAEFAGPERRAIGERARHLGTSTGHTRPDAGAAVDPARAERVRPTLRLLLGRDLLNFVESS